MPFSISAAVLLRSALEYRRAGRLADAEQLCRQILAHVPEDAGALQLLGSIAAQTSRRQEAAELLRRALRVNANLPVVWSELGAVLHELGRIDEAIAACEEAIRRSPTEVKALKRLAVLFWEQGRFPESVSAGYQALAREPRDPNTCFILANSLWIGGETDAAIAMYRRALELRPDYLAAQVNLAGPLEASGRWSEAEACYRRVIELRPDFGIAHNNLGNLLGRQGRIDEALACHRQALVLDPGSPATHSNLLTHLHYSPRYSAHDLRAAHEQYEQFHGGPRRQFWIREDSRRAIVGPLRLGFVSPHFARHPVGRFLVRVLESLPNGEFEIYCYSDTVTADEMTARLRSTAAHWRDTRDFTEEQLDRCIRDDRINILFDLAGHTAGNRLPVFARKPAPIQISWLDYVGTTGLAAMDYLIADPRQIPPGAEVHFSEKILRLPDGYICFDPPADAPEPGPLPAAVRGGITFGNFSVLSKITPETLALWAEVLQRVPGSRLLLKNQGLEQAPIQARIRGLLPGLAPERVEFCGWSSAPEALAAYREVDLALDTVPYNGGLTICEALWMGVPVITCPGETFASRHGLAHLTAAGFTETIATDLRHYVELAVAWATDLDRLAQTRSELRSRVSGSPLVDGPRFARHFANLMHAVWGKTSP